MTAHTPAGFYRRRFACAIGASLALGLTPSWATPAASTLADKWPTQTVRLVVGFPAGSSPDLTARALAEPLAKALGHNVIVENKVGAGGNIAADFVAKSTDGHTLGLMINGNMTIARILNPKVPYDPLKDLAPISLIGKAPLVLTVPASAPGVAPGQTAAEWLSQAQKAGDKLSYASPGVGTVAHLGMELLKTKAGIAPVHVPYPGNPQIITAMLGGQVQLALLPPAMAAAQVRGGQTAGDWLDQFWSQLGDRRSTQPERDRCKGLPAGNLERRGCTLFDTSGRGQQVVGHGQRHRACARDACAFVPARLASGGLIA